MNNNNSKKFNLYTQGQRWAVRVLLMVGMCFSTNLAHALTKGQGVLRLLETAVVGILALGGQLPGGSALGPLDECPSGLESCPDLEVDATTIGSSRKLNILGDLRTKRNRRTTRNNVIKAMKDASSTECKTTREKLCTMKEDVEKPDWWDQQYIILKCHYDGFGKDIAVEDIFECLKQIEDDKNADKIEILTDSRWVIDLWDYNHGANSDHLKLDKLLDLPVDWLKMRDVFLEFPEKIEQSTTLAQYLFHLDINFTNPQSNPLVLPSDFTNFKKLKELYIEGAVGTLPDIPSMNKLRDVTLNLSCTGITEVSEELRKLVHNMGNKLGDRFQCNLDCNPLEAIPSDWYFIFRVLDSGHDDGRYDKSVTIGNEGCASHCCGNQGCPSLTDLLDKWVAPGPKPERDVPVSSGLGFGGK